MSRIKEIVKATPLIGDVARFIGKYRTRVPAGHFYSPIVSTEEIRKREAQIYPPPPRTLPGLDLREEAHEARGHRRREREPPESGAHEPGTLLRLGRLTDPRT